MLQRRCPYTLSSWFEICDVVQWMTGRRWDESLQRGRLLHQQANNTHHGGEEHQVVVVHPQHVPLLELAHLQQQKQPRHRCVIGWCWVSRRRADKRTLLRTFLSQPARQPAHACTHLHHHVAEELVDLAIRLPPVLLAPAVPDLLRVRLLVVPVRPGWSKAAGVGSGSGLGVANNLTAHF